MNVSSTGIDPITKGNHQSRRQRSREESVIMVDMDIPRGSESLWPIVHRVVGPSEAVRRRRVEEDEFIRLFVWAGVDQISEGLGQLLVEGLGDEDLVAQ